MRQGRFRAVGGTGDGRDRTVGIGAIEPDRWPGIGHDVTVTTDLVTPGPTGLEENHRCGATAFPAAEVRLIPLGRCEVPEIPARMWGGQE
jgi:hypothetical protein